MLKFRTSLLMGTALAAGLAQAAGAESFNIPAGDLASALDSYMRQTGSALIISGDEVKASRTKGAHGNLTPDEALSQILVGTGFVIRKDSGALVITRGRQSTEVVSVQPLQLAQATPARAAVETVTVTSSKLGGADVQSIPIAITALSQEQLTATQTAGGPDLIKQVPNMTFTKTNFSGYSIQIRGIGTQAISVTTDPAVAVAFNDTPFIRNHFFEQEFYDVSQVEILRGPQGTLYGRNATAGVVNLTSAKPTDQFEAMASGEFGNYGQRRFEGMINLPLVDDWLDVRIAGEWTKRNGYTHNEYDGDNIDGRDLWSARLSVGWHPYEDLKVNFVWEHFAEDDDRLRSGKQLCTRAPQPESIGGQPVTPGASLFETFSSYLDQGCQMGSLYAKSAFGTPDGYSLPYSFIAFGGDPYGTQVQSPDLRTINSQLTPTYKAKNDTAELIANYQLSPSLTLTSETGFSQDFLWSTEDYNRFGSVPGMFGPGSSTPGSPIQSTDGPYGVFCDPQVGCSSGLLAEDLSEEHAWQASQEFRLASHSSGPFNFSVGGNYLHYETAESYYVFANTLTYFANGESVDTNPAHPRGVPWYPGITDDHECLQRYGGLVYHDPALGGG